MKKLKNEKMIYYILWGICFGLVCVCHFLGCYSRIVSGIMLIMWTLNGFLAGKLYGNERIEEELEETRAIINFQHEIIVELDKKYHITERSEDK